MDIKKARDLIRETDRNVCKCCMERFYSPFDILFIYEYGSCVDCFSKAYSDEIIEEMSKPIFELIEKL